MCTDAANFFYRGYCALINCLTRRKNLVVQWQRLLFRALRQQVRIGLQCFAISWEVAKFFNLIVLLIIGIELFEWNL